jgi:hypothetical protein
MFSLVIAFGLILALIALYWFVIRPRGAHVLATYRDAGGGWTGIKAVFWGYLTPIMGILGTIVYAIPELLTVASGIDFKTVLPEPWGLYVAAGMPFFMVLMKAFAATPTGTPPKGEE